MKLPALHIHIQESSSQPDKRHWPASMTFPKYQYDIIFRPYNTIIRNNTRFFVLPIQWETVKPVISLH
ncbi:hypothetical protein OAP63_14175 [Vibrio sp.]|uniref:Uncharacterized protein n=1 Tax=Vibrio viridaestus TaxID=2487322 RepID=A0A3N9U9H1_9VIBR|nr:hypothetical protein [Vibrio viridaestus]MDC0611875.1 hypothetical protein [Vibrio sp.]RQW64866.1 hypothetical protein EES38_02170 [Vibrio viridaestus]